MCLFLSQLPPSLSETSPSRLQHKGVHFYKTSEMFIPIKAIYVCSSFTLEKPKYPTKSSKEQILFKVYNNDSRKTSKEVVLVYSLSTLSRCFLTELKTTTASQPHWHLSMLSFFAGFKHNFFFLARLKDHRCNT